MICSTIGIVSVAPAPKETGISTGLDTWQRRRDDIVAGRQTGAPVGAVRAGHMCLAPAGAGHRHHDARSGAPVRVDDGAFDRARRLAGRQRGGRQRPQYGAMARRAGGQATSVMALIRAIPSRRILLARRPAAARRRLDASKRRSRETPPQSVASSPRHATITRPCHRGGAHRRSPAQSPRRGGRRPRPGPGRRPPRGPPVVA